MTPRSLLDIVPVIPVVVVHDAADAVPIARALVAGGLPIIELTLRTPAALAAIERIADEVPEIIVGAGTIVDTAQPKQALAAGAQFLVSPGSTADLRAAMRDTGLPHLPGVATVSEVMAPAGRRLHRHEVLPRRSRRAARRTCGRSTPLYPPPGSARPAGSPRRTWRNTSRRRTLVVSAAAGSPLPMPCKAMTGNVFPASPQSPQRWPTLRCGDPELHDRFT